MIRTGLILLLAVLLIGSYTLAGPAAQQPDTASDLSGIYECDGRNGDGSRYEGYVVIARHGDTYRVQWIFESRRGATGIGIRDGNTLAVSYFGGLAMYRIDGAQLVGRWTVPDAQGVLSSETLNRVKDLPPDVERPEAEPPARRPQAQPAPGIRL